MNFLSWLGTLVLFFGGMYYASSRGSPPMESQLVEAYLGGVLVGVLIIFLHAFL